MNIPSGFRVLGDTESSIPLEICSVDLPLATMGVLMKVLSAVGSGGMDTLPQPTCHHRDHWSLTGRPQRYCGFGSRPLQ